MPEPQPRICPKCGHYGCVFDNINRLAEGETDA